MGCRDLALPGDTDRLIRFRPSGRNNRRAAIIRVGALFLCLLVLFTAGCATRPVQQEAPPEIGETTPLSPMLRARQDQTTTSNEQRAADLWERLRAGFRLNAGQRPEVDHWIRYYSAHAYAVEQTLQRAEPFLWRIVHEVDKRGMPMEIALLPAVESAFDPFALSRGNASGLWQFVPGTAKRFGLRRNWWYDGRRDMVHSTRAALDYLQYLAKIFDDNWILAIAAYNAGGGRLQAAIRQNQARGEAADFWHLRLPGETRQYVPKLLALAALIRQPQRYGLRLPALPDKPLLAQVEVPGQIDLALAARLAGIPLSELRELNAGYRRWATEPDGDPQLLIPRARAKQFEIALAKVPASRLVTWRRHQVARGDTLSAIASRYGTTVALLERINHLSSSRIHIGKTLLVPGAPGTRDESAVASRDDAQPAQAVDYVVRAGDSLWRIAQRHQISVDALRRGNGLQAGDVLQPGQHLSIPATGHDTERTVHYSVRQGDSLWAIAQRYDVTVSDLRRWNGLADNAYLQPGQRLEVKIQMAAR